MTSCRGALSILLGLACAGAGADAAARGAQENPVTWSARAVSKGLRPGGTVDVAISAVAEEEWHVYSVTQGPGGPMRLFGESVKSMHRQCQYRWPI